MYVDISYSSQDKQIVCYQNVILLRGSDLYEAHLQKLDKKESKNMGSSIK